MKQNLPTFYAQGVYTIDIHAAAAYKSLPTQLLSFASKRWHKMNYLYSSRLGKALLISKWSSKNVHVHSK